LRSAALTRRSARCCAVPHAQRLAERGAAVLGICPSSASKNAVGRKQVPLLIPRAELQRDFGLGFDKTSCMDYYEVMSGDTNNWSHFYPVEQLIAFAPLLTGKPASCALEELAIRAAEKAERKAIKDEEAAAALAVTLGRRKRVICGWLEAALQGVFTTLVTPFASTSGTPLELNQRAQQREYTSDAIIRYVDKAMKSESAKQVSRFDGDAIDDGETTIRIEHWIRCWLLRCMATTLHKFGIGSHPNITQEEFLLDYVYPREYMVLPVAHMPLVHKEWTRLNHCMYPEQFKLEVASLLEVIHYYKNDKRLKRQGTFDIPNDVFDIIIGHLAPRFDPIAMMWLFPGDEAPEPPGRFPSISGRYLNNSGECWKGLPRIYALTRASSDASMGPKKQAVVHPTVQTTYHGDVVRTLQCKPHWSTTDLYVHVHCRWTNGQSEEEVQGGARRKRKQAARNAPPPRAPALT
jgi:hypothetical protein